MSNLEWDSKTVIGSKGKVAKVTRTTSDLNGAWCSLSLACAEVLTLLPQLYVSSVSHADLCRLTGRWIGPTSGCGRGDRQEGDSRDEQGSCWCVAVIPRPPSTPLSDPPAAGTDHQRIAKLDRENEVAPPPKILPSVGKVSRPPALSPPEP